MQIIYEVSGTFRVMCIPECARFIGDKKPVKRATPFVLAYRAPGALAAESMELTDELFQLFLTVETDVARVIHKYINPKFGMSEGMLEQLLACPKALLAFVPNTCPKTEEGDPAARTN